ncbi:putative UDP-glucose 6-dehydrogenase [Frankia casuarinae]|nr:MULTISPECIES: UDP-glucose/GDP-mannose dehydrogenase family protein [Frankia]ETA03501.1 putative UDP-glucose 6-dehydrogenase [Frankia sp. CcI6]EYT93548.1 putative UDP-glucose 6-dehydrogenase [Frankia casuarinae]OHV55667.1 UDP-glucose 6-dehydrogenase [Frankia sp. CgIS1]TFE31398.1 UDP-glucose/GDP-mannose dehydrogenase family protein [Frankia sp. B2]
MSSSDSLDDAAAPGTGPRPRLTVIGTGYLGATHAVCMAELGFEVLAVDVDHSKIERLSAGEIPFFEPDLADLLRANLRTGRLRFTTSFEEIAEFGDVHFVCVGTPQRADGYGADLSHLHAAIERLAPLLTRPCLVVGKSTVPAGTAAGLARTIAQLAPANRPVAGETAPGAAGADGLGRVEVGHDGLGHDEVDEPAADISSDLAGVQLAWNPEFLREGFAVADTLRPDRLVFGVASPAAEGALRAAFAPVIAQGVPVIVTDYATAELVKTAANSFLATKISFINAMAEVCEAVDADVLTLAEALSHDVRIGGNFLRPGVGFGGGCLPKDIRAFQARADELGVGAALRFLREIDEINNRRRDRVVDLVTAALDGTLVGRRLVVLGAAFKPNSDDVRDSPALAVAGLLAETGAGVTVVDPVATHNARQALPGLAYSDSVEAVVEGADALVLLTEWRQFADLDPARLGAVVRRKVVVDARHALDADQWRQAGWVYLAPGRPTGVIPSSLPEQRHRGDGAPPAPVEQCGETGARLAEVEARAGHPV